MYNCVYSGETKQTTVPGNDFEQGPVEKVNGTSNQIQQQHRKRADMSINTQNAAPQNSGKSIHSYGFNSSFQ